MAEDLAELGLEGLNHLTDRYHDFVYDHIPAFPHHKKHQVQPPAAAAAAAAAAPPPPPPPPADPPKPASRAPPTEHSRDQLVRMDYDRNYDYRDSALRHHRRRDSSPPRDGPSWERSYYGRPISEAGSQDEGRRRYSAAAATPLPLSSYERGYPPAAGYLPPAPDAPRHMPPCDPVPPPSRGRPRARARSVVSRSPTPEKKHKWDKRSEGGAAFASAVVGALAGGLAGNELGKGDTLTTLASAVIGAVGGTELEKQYEKKQRKDARRQKDWERRNGRDGREVRRIEIEREYGYGAPTNYYERDYWDDERRRRRSR